MRKGWLISVVGVPVLIGIAILVFYLFILKGEEEHMNELVERVQASGGTIQTIGGGRPAALVLPKPPRPGATPLIVSLHGYTGSAGQHDFYISLAERVNVDGIAVLLPNGSLGVDGQRFWNATDWCCDFNDSGVDDVAYLSGLVEEARGYIEVGPVYFFGHSNGGFMSYRMACESLPGLRAVASLAGTSFIDGSRCDGAAPVSVLHIHGTADTVVRYDGSEHSSKPAFRDEESYAGAEELAQRWATRAGCDLDAQELRKPVDLDEGVDGAETVPLRYTVGCEEGITVELWRGDGSAHTPQYSDAFLDALIEWLLAQE